MGNKNIERFIVLFIPWALASLLASDPALSYLIAWAGSFLIFALTLTGWVVPLPSDRSFSEQLMRPLFVMQIIFAGYMSCTSIFYFMNVLGYDNFVKPALVTVSQDKLLITAQCQRYYCLGHAAFASGILMFMDYPKKKKYYIEKDTLSTLLIRLALITFPVSILFLRVPGLTQFYFQFSSLSFIAGTLALAFAIPLKKSANTMICGMLYLFNFYNAMTSGFKEPIIISVLVLGIFLYPNYKKTVTVVFLPVLFLLFIVLPVYMGAFRGIAAEGDADADEAAHGALDAALNEEDNSNWGFLVFRLSEIDMFTNFVQSTPSTVDYYGTLLFEQSAIAVVPRVFWPSKPITEALVMERVYNAGVINRGSQVSAKPAVIVDAYLTAGPIGIALCLWAYGAIAQLISVKAEELFGGYILGSALIFSGLFQSFWRGLSFEFMINSIFWSYVSMIVIFRIMKSRNILKEV